MRVLLCVELSDNMLLTEELYQKLYNNMGEQRWWPAESPIEMMLGAILCKIRIGRMLIWL